ncbi:MAG: hypothetical protein AB7O59_14930 [Pirellulales bacterium]
MSGQDSILTELLTDCDAQGIRLFLAGNGGLTIDAAHDALTPELLEQLRTHKTEMIAHLRPKARLEPRLALPTIATKAVCRCGSATWLDVPIHDGQSTRRDCARCGRFIDFSRWYGQSALQAGE